MSTPMHGGKTKEVVRQELEALYLANREMVLQAAFFTLRNKVDAEDVLQTVFQKLLQREDPDPSFLKNPKSYLYRAAVNEAIDVIESRKRYEGMDATGDAEDENAAKALDALEIPPDAAMGPDRIHDILRVRAAIGKIHPGYAELLRLYYTEGYNCLEIAKLQNKYPHSIFMGLNRARAAVRKVLVNQEKERETQENDHQRGRKSLLAKAFGR